MSVLQSQCRSEGSESANVTGEQIAAAVRVGAGLSNHGNILLSDRAPLTDRLVSLSTGSVPLLHWSAHEPVTFDDDRATRPSPVRYTTQPGLAAGDLRQRGRRVETDP